MPWRNGKGVTREIAREPATGEDYAWRLSLADIECDGDFSAYPGYRRALVLVAGKRLHLRFRGHGGRALDPDRRGARFEGNWQTHAAVPQGPCTDLSLIVRAYATGPSAVVRAPRTLRIQSTGHIALRGDACAALFVIEGSVAVSESLRARPRTLRTRDTLLITPGPQRTLRLRSRGRSGAQLDLLLWRAAAAVSRAPSRDPGDRAPR